MYWCDTNFVLLKDQDGLSMLAPGPSYPQPQPPTIRVRKVYVSLPPRGSHLLSHSPTYLSEVNHQDETRMSVGPSDNTLPVRSQKHRRSPCHSLFSDNSAFHSDPETTSSDDFSPPAPSGKRSKATQDTSLVSGPSHLRPQSPRANQVYRPLPPTGPALVSFVQPRKRRRCHSFSDDGSFSLSRSYPEISSEDDFSPNKKYAPSHKRAKAVHTTMHPLESRGSIEISSLTTHLHNSRPLQTQTSRAAGPREAIGEDSGSLPLLQTCDIGSGLQTPTGILPLPTSTLEQLPVKVIKRGSFFTYEFEGVLCQHMLGPNQTSLPLSDRLPPAPVEGLTLSEKDMDKRCAGLNAHHISMFPPMDAFFCHRHKVFVLPSSIKSHIIKLHTKTLPSGNTVRQNFFMHLQQLYPAISDRTSPSKSKRHFLISQPISFLPDPARFVFCPSVSCPSVFEWNTVAPGTLSISYQYHMRDSASCEAAQTFMEVGNKKLVKQTLRYAQLSGRGASVRWVFYLPDDWAPLSASPAAPPADHPLRTSRKTKLPEELHSTDLTLCQPYVAQLGWDKAFPVQYIIAFKALLKMPIASDASAEELALQDGISDIRNFLYGYLESANKYVEGQCRIVRESITKRYCLVIMHHLDTSH